MSLPGLADRGRARLYCCDDVVERWVCAQLTRVRGWSDLCESKQTCDRSLYGCIWFVLEVCGF